MPPRQAAPTRHDRGGRSAGKARGGIPRLWLEASNVNVPGVAAYNRLGYTLCGADQLYYGSYMPGETAIYLAMQL